MTQKILGDQSMPVLKDGDPRLREVSEEIPINAPGKISMQYRALSQAMFETMLAKGGIGIAAPQVGQRVRMVVILGTDQDGVPIPYTFVNPTWVPLSDHKRRMREGCLSVPGKHGFVERYADICVGAWDINGGYGQVELTGHDAALLQHEIDHLDGVLFTDRIAEQGGTISG